MNAVVVHLKNRGVEFSVAGNDETHSSCQGEGVSNHKEGEPSIIMGLCVINIIDKRVVVYGNDVDLLTLLLAYHKRIVCLDLHTNSLKGYTPMTPVHQFLGENVASVPLVFHTLTGNDIAGKFRGESKDFW